MPQSHVIYPTVEIAHLDDAAAVAAGMQVFNLPDRHSCGVAVGALGWLAGQVGRVVVVTEAKPTPFADRGADGPHSFFAKVKP